MMVLASGLALLFLTAPQAAPRELVRKFTKGDKASYSIQSELQVEERGGSLDTFIPSDLTIKYGFTTEVVSLGVDGIGKVRYVRPTITEIEGETFDSPPKTRVEKLNQNTLLTVSPINEIIDVTDSKPAKPAKGSGTLRTFLPEGMERLQNPITQFVGEIYRIALFLGPLDSSLDFAPKLPIDEVSVGDTWKKTVGYQPQTLKGTDQKAVQRLDYVYTFKGPATVNGKPVLRIVGDLSLKTDLGTFINQMMKMTPEASGLKSIPLEVKGQITFDLDPKTLATISAVGTTEGGYKIQLTRDAADYFVMESRLKGKTVMKKTG